MPRSEHNIHYQTSAQTWDEGLPLGNGVLGALVWGDGNPLNISLDRTDLWDLRPIPEFHAPEYSYATARRWHEEGRHADLIRLLEAPYDRAAPTKIPAGRIEISGGEFESSTLNIQRALADVKFGDNANIEIFLHATLPLGVLRLCGIPDAKFHLRAPAFGGESKNLADANRQSFGDLSKLGYAAPQEYSGENFCGFEQIGWGDFRFAAHLAWRAVGDEILAAWTVASNFETEDEGDNVRAIARQRMDAALTQSFDELLEPHQKWWCDFWKESSLQLPDKELEKQWFLENYKFGAAARRDAPPITLQGPWTEEDGGLPPWKGDYHHDLNTQLSYWPCYSGNHLEAGLGFLDWLWQTREDCRNWTQRFFQMPGLNVPMTADLNNNQIGGWRQYTHSATTAAWLCHHFYLHWKFSGDREFLETRAYPYLRECAIFIEAITQERDANGLRTLPLSSSPEIHNNDPQAWFDSITNYDLALIRWLMGATAEMAEALGENCDAQLWLGVLREMPALALDENGALLLEAGQPLRESHRHFSHLVAIHPLGLIAPSDEKQCRIIGASLAQLEELGTKFWTGYSFAWLGNISARIGDGERAVKALKTFLAFTLRNSFHVNGDQSGEGFSDFTYRPFTLEGNFAFAAGIQEMLLRSECGVLRVFPAIPDLWREVSFENLRGQGAFLVSAAMHNGGIAHVEIRAERGGLCRVLLRGAGQMQEKQMQSGEVWKLKV